MMNETSMKCFLSLARTLNFTKTAKELFMSQQSVSQHISKLEAGLGFPLFTRTRHFVELTRAGQRYYEFFSDVSARYQELHSECADHYTSLFKTLKVGYQNWSYLGPAANKAMDELWRQIPGLEIEITRRSPGLLVHKFKNRELQLVVLYERWVPKTEGIRVTRLMELELVLLISASNPLATDDADYTTFSDEPFIIDGFEHEQTADTNRRIRKETNLLGFTPSRVIVMPDREAAYTAAEMGQGFVLSTNINLIAKSANLRAYPTGIKETLVCVWFADDENESVHRYARCLQEAYHNTPEERPKDVN